MSTTIKVGVFSDFKKAMDKQLKKLTTGKLYTTTIDPNALWEAYLEAFPAGTNDLHKERRSHDCSACKQFTRKIGNVVSIDDNQKLTSIWDMPNLSYPYNVVAEKLSALVKAEPINQILTVPKPAVGVDKTFDGQNTWEHFSYVLPASHVAQGKSTEAIRGNALETVTMLKRALTELTVDALNAVLDLIAQNSLYRGNEFLKSVKDFLDKKKAYDKLSPLEQNNWLWATASTTGPTVTRIRNTAIGTLLIDLSADMDLDEAVKRFENVVAPTNYKRPTALVTKAMIESAQKEVEQLGYTNSLGRRFAVAEDLTVNNVMFVNRSTKSKLGGSVFDSLKADLPVSQKNLSKVEEISIDDFMTNVLPNASSLSVLFENRHRPNLMSLMAPLDKEAPSMLKWNNNFSWAYNGNIADSSIRQNVAKAGGCVTGVLRFSIQWNEKGDNRNDYDAHAVEPKGNRLCFRNMRNSGTSGVLDVDITQPKKDEVAVENITWDNLDKMLEGEYTFSVHNYCHRGGVSGFSAELAFGDEIYSLDYPHNLKDNGEVIVAKVSYTKANGFKILESLDLQQSTKEYWGIKTNQFIPVSMVTLSPNYWEGEVGNKHYLFILEDCKADTPIRGYFNEFLKEELTPHRKVFETIGNKLLVEPTEDQLSGLGFSSTQRNSVTVQVEGAFNRTLKVVF